MSLGIEAMQWSPIVKSSVSQNVAPNLCDYAQTRAEFSREQARQLLDGLPNGRGLNIAHESVDRHANGLRSQHVALRWLGKADEIREVSYSQLRDATNRFANVLTNLGVTNGDRVFVLAGRIPELHFTPLGTLKNRSVFCPLFSAFGPESIRSRMNIGTPNVLVTTELLYQTKIAPLRDSLPLLEHVLLVSEDHLPTNVPGTQDVRRLMEVAGDRFTIAPTDPEGLALLHFTSGTTGNPKPRHTSTTRPSSHRRRSSSSRHSPRHAVERSCVAC